MSSMHSEDDYNDINAQDIEDAAQDDLMDQEEDNINSLKLNNNNNINNNNNNNNTGDLMDDNKAPEFPALSASSLNDGSIEYQRIPVPPHRLV